MTAGALHQFTLQASKVKTSADYLSGVKNLGQSTQGITDTASSGSSVISSEYDATDFDISARLQTFFDPETGDTFTLTPRTSVHSDSGDPEGQTINLSGEEDPRILTNVSQNP